jgi:hypothetical protein
MGPLFSLIILGVVGSVATTVTFVVLRFFLPMRDAALAALLTVASGGVGCFLGMLVQAVAFPLSNPSGAQIVDFFWISLATGAASAGLALWLFVKMRAARAERRRVETFD